MGPSVSQPARYGKRKSGYVALRSLARGGLGEKKYGKTVASVGKWVLPAPVSVCLVCVFFFWNQDRGCFLS